MTAAPASGSVQPGPDVVLQSTLPRTPQTTLALANMLRDPMGRERCPFGVDFEEQTVGFPFHKTTFEIAGLMYTE